jgi:hypothetical protein
MTAGTEHDWMSVASSDDARAAVRLATLPAEGPTGGFFNEEGPVPW